MEELTVQKPLENTFYPRKVQNEKNYSIISKNDYKEPDQFKVVTPACQVTQLVQEYFMPCLNHKHKQYSGCSFGCKTSLQFLVHCLIQLRFFPMDIYLWTFWIYNACFISMSLCFFIHKLQILALTITETSKSFLFSLVFALFPLNPLPLHG